MTGPQSQKAGRPKASKGLYKYYQIHIRNKKGISPEALEGIRKIIWKYLGNVGMVDIMARKGNKSATIKWRVG